MSAGGFPQETWATGAWLGQAADSSGFLCTTHARYRARRLARQSAVGERQLHEYMIVHPTVALTYSELTRLKAKGSRSGS